MFAKMIADDNKKDDELRAQRDVVRADFILFAKWMMIIDSFQLKALYVMQLTRDAGNTLNRKQSYAMIKANDLQGLYAAITA